MDLPAARLENSSKPHAIPLLGMPQASVYDHFPLAKIRL